MKLREYQVEAIRAVYDYFLRNTGNPLIAMPTGTGKSLVIAGLVQSAMWNWPNQRILILSHVKELLAQNHDKLLTLWPAAPVGIYSAGLGKKQTTKAITMAGIGSIAKKAEIFRHIDLIIIDEAHMVSDAEDTLYRTFIKDLKVINPNLKVIGLTATAWRLGTGKLTDNGVFTDICFNITGLQAFNRLIAEGYLAPLIPRQTKQMLDVDGVHSRAGEFVASELQIAVDKLEVTQAALKEVLECAGGRNHWLIFASGVEHAIHISDMLNDMGVSSVAIHGKMGETERDAAIAGFKAGKYVAAVNNNVLTTGFDFPGIDLIIVLRPTMSTVLWVQMLGRGTRPLSGKENCLVLDFAGNTRRLGPINDPVIPRKKGDKVGGEAPVKLCGTCATYNHASVTHCVCCGAEFSFQVKIKQTSSSAELLKGDMPITEVFKVDHLTYSRHEKQGRPPMLKVTYYCGLRAFSEYVCVEHEGFAQRKARIWWKERSDTPIPLSTDQAIAATDYIKPATHLRVWVNKQYPEIMNHCFDGSAFGKTEATDTRPQVSKALPKPPASEADYTDDDIPF